MYDPALPYASRRAPVAADNIVATSQPLAVQAGIDALRRGGNAVDAALASAITLTVVEPNNNGVGSDAFCILWDGERLVGLNASGRAPALWTPQRFAGREKVPTWGWDAVTVPGAVSAWVALSQRYGALPFADLFEAAVHYAEEGFLVGPKTAFYWQLMAEHYSQFPAFAAHFLPAPRPGERFRRPELAHTLRLIAQSEGEAFYHGELAYAIESAALEQGGAMRRQDLAAHAADWVTPLAQDYRGVTLHEIPPNGQGLAALIALGILEHLPAPALDSEAWVHQQVEVMKIAVRAAQEHISDPDYLHKTPAELLDPQDLARAAAVVGAEARPLPPVALPVGPDTVYLTTADAGGMMVSYIQSNFLAFGSGIVIPGTGIAMQNRGSGFSLQPGHPNIVGPGKRPFHTIIPGFVTRDGNPLLSFGVMGGHMQHQGHVQMVSRICEHGQNPQAASDAPRWHVYPDFRVGLEAGFPPALRDSLAARGHSVGFDEQESTFGGAQLIQRLPQGYVAGSD
ncbi:MAG: gamma-glutamyltransferase family protein, partial [Pseudomonadota bacterium]